jgi:phosphohistidine phosphatase SixA|tara:strand:+ start:52 stop:600 length:549 start_codon:yes stop_codon:yes gene_type:complete
MKKILILLFFLSFFNSAQSNQDLIESLQTGGKLVFIRHALAPGGGDPDNFKLNDCSTQRNLNQVGINQSKKIGSFFIQNKIPIDKVLSSEWCRCKDTAKYAFNKYKTYNALNSFFSTKYAKNKKKQIRNLKKYIQEWNGKKNLVFVTHYVVILEMMDLPTSSGEIVISDKNLNLIGAIETSN